MTDKPRTRIYRGIDGNAEGKNTRILVVDGGGDPTARERYATTLYELAPESPFWWGYGGGSPARTAAAILADVLPDLEADIPALADMPSSFRSELTKALLRDFIAHFHDEQEFWLPAQTVIRWAHGYLREARTH